MSVPLKRCALYTRKSSEEGLDQEFNSLDAQREACEAYVKSQASEGWRSIDANYDDGGISGGTMGRPALQRLLADIALGKVDVVVVYKIDRLTRSLADFARMVELFDRHEVSFVSVTQSFNTTSSMGRLTLNVLLSFAQFEREVTGERIRDKIAASKAKGMWMGGRLPLGYDSPKKGSRALVVNECEAETVRLIYRTYLELSSVHELERWLKARGIRSKQHTTRKGKKTGDQPFSRGALFRLLRNRTYLGMIVHKDTVHPGMHPAIVESELFEEVQSLMDANKRRTSESRNNVADAPLVGRIFDADGEPMSPTFSRGARGKLYRYYVSASLQQGQKPPADDSITRRVPAALLEKTLLETIKRTINKKNGDSLACLSRVEIHRENVHLLMSVKYLAQMRTNLDDGEHAEQDPVDPKQLRLSLPVRFATSRGRTQIIGGCSQQPKPDPILIKALRTAHTMIKKDKHKLPMMMFAPTTPWRRKLVRLAFLAPDLQQAIMVGNQPTGLTLSYLMDEDMPLSWEDQRQWICAHSKTQANKAPDPKRETPVTT
ncbi:MAG: recombinase family protein [Rhizobiaceae bacterium]|nr:recombinase family protein [Rhizobiaceae bacterium]